MTEMLLKSHTHLMVHDVHTSNSQLIHFNVQDFVLGFSGCCRDSGTYTSTALFN